MKTYKILYKENGGLVLQFITILNNIYAFHQRFFVHLKTTNK